MNAELRYDTGMTYRLPGSIEKYKLKVNRYEYGNRTTVNIEFDAHEKYVSNDRRKCEFWMPEEAAKVLAENILTVLGKRTVPRIEINIDESLRDAGEK